MVIMQANKLSEAKPEIQPTIAEKPAVAADLSNHAADVQAIGCRQIRK